MEFSMIGMALTADEPAATAAWFVEHLGFKVGIDLGWYVNTQHPAHPAVSVDFVQRDHPSWPAVIRGKNVAGALLAFLVPDVDAEFERLRDRVDVVLEPVTEPWGQRRFQITGPDGVVVEILQLVTPDPQWLAENNLA